VIYRLFALRDIGAKAGYTESNLIDVVSWILAFDDTCVYKNIYDGSKSRVICPWRTVKPDLDLGTGSLPGGRREIFELGTLCG
jgi:hypothetical protein